MMNMILLYRFEDKECSFICNKCGSKLMGPVDRPSPPVNRYRYSPKRVRRGGLRVVGEVLTTVLEPGTPGSPEESLATRLFIPRVRKK